MPTDDRLTTALADALRDRLHDGLPADVPGLGRFVVRTHAARLRTQEQRRTLDPPRTRIEFEAASSDDRSRHS